jgi:predicted kinase
VRAKVACLRHAQGDELAATEARWLHDLAADHLDLGAVRLVLVGGLPGTGKSTVARELGTRLDAVVLSTDELRKELAGIERTASAGAPPHEGLYTPEKVRAVYDELLREAATLLERGESVVLDASWTAAANRSAARAVASDHVAMLSEVQCVAPTPLSLDRVRTRRARHDDPSDADEAVALALAAEAQPWPESTTIDTSRHLEATVADAMRAVRAS